MAPTGIAKGKRTQTVSTAPRGGVGSGLWEIVTHTADHPRSSTTWQCRVAAWLHSALDRSTSATVAHLALFGRHLKAQSAKARWRSSKTMQKRIKFRHTQEWQPPCDVDEGVVRTVPNCSELPPEQKCSELFPSGTLRVHFGTLPVRTSVKC